MLHRNSCRRLEVLVYGEWTECGDQGRLEIGDRCRMFDSLSRPVLDNDGYHEFIVKAVPAIECEGVRNYEPWTPPGDDE